jgi:hypothetical protein
MYLTALTLGGSVPQTDFDATIHSVFHSAANLNIGNGDFLLTLTASGEADLPQGIRVDTPADFSFEKLRVDSGANCQNGILTCENAALTIELVRARRWKCDLASLEADMSHPAAESAWQTVWQALNERQRGQGAEIIGDELLRWDEHQSDGVARRAGHAMTNMMAAAQHFDLVATFGARNLIGLGGGLTPCGDDLLVGYMAGLWCTTRGKPKRLRFITDFGQAVTRLALRTNDISRTYLYHAARGQVSSRLESLAGAISGGESEPYLLAAAKLAMNAGHTSGMDAVTGLLLGLLAWDGGRN